MVYKIYNEKTKEFRHAGHSPRYSKTGKTWEKKRHLTNAINNFEESEEDLKNIVVVEGNFVIVNEIPILEYMKEAKERKMEREKTQHKFEIQQNQKRKFKEYLKLKEELGL